MTLIEATKEAQARGYAKASAGGFAKQTDGAVTDEVDETELGARMRCTTLQEVRQWRMRRMC